MRKRGRARPATHLLLEAARREAPAGPRTPRGHLMLAALGPSVVPLQASMEDVMAISADRWPGLTAAFDALNPRAFIPVASTVSLLGALGKTRALKAFRAWSEQLARPDVLDEERHRRLSAALGTLLRSDYVWIPALAWLLDQLSWDAVLDMTVETFGPNQGARADPEGSRADPEGSRADPDPPERLPKAKGDYRHVEIAILRENLLRHHARLEEIWLDAFSGAEAPAQACPFPRLATLVLRTARRYLADRAGQRLGDPSRAAADSIAAPCSPAEVKALTQGLLGQIIRLPPEEHSSRSKLHAVLRSFRNDLPPWSLVYLRVVP
jgi:hypothetical protein